MPTALGKVIDKGTRFDQLPRRPVEEDTFAQLVQLLRQPGPLAIAMCHVASAAQYEDLIEVFLRVLNTRKVISRFLKAVIEMEVSFTGEPSMLRRARRNSADLSAFADHESTLFRGNSFATRILTVYARARGYHYLRNTLRDLLLTLCSKPPEFSMVSVKLDAPCRSKLTRRFAFNRTLTLTAKPLTTTSPRATWSK